MRYETLPKYAIPSKHSRDGRFTGAQDRRFGLLPVPSGAWQTARTLLAYAAIGCVVPSEWYSQTTTELPQVVPNVG